MFGSESRDHGANISYGRGKVRLVCIGFVSKQVSAYFIGMVSRQRIRERTRSTFRVR